MIMIIIGVVLIAACIGLFVWNLLDSERAREDMDERLDLISEAIEERRTEEKSIDEPTTDEQSKTSETPSLPVVTDGKLLPVAELDGYEYIGYLTVPSVELRLPVMNTCDDRSLRVAAPSASRLRRCSRWRSPGRRLDTGSC